MTLQGRGLSIGYRERVVGRGLDVSLEQGEVLALLGPNGSGKTTLLKTLLGILPPLAGTAQIDGQPIATFSAPQRARRIAYVPQSHVPTFGFTVETVVLMGRTAHGSLLRAPSAADRVVAEYALARFGITALKERPYTMISGGERQLVLLARALAQEPHFIVLDEPTASLDFGNQGKVMREIRALAAAGLGVLFTTHDPNSRAARRRPRFPYPRRAMRRGRRRARRAHPGAAGGPLRGASRDADRCGDRHDRIPAGLKAPRRKRRAEAPR